ncbi:MAG: hypothetical protein EOO69_12080 [Moraxellaceae bacterium]|nr:MAG: hypothetical protein EOO69_12080 [Moraxellaceae bacterium]
MSNLSNLIQGMLVNALGQNSGSTNHSANGNGLDDVLGGRLNGQNQQMKKAVIENRTAFL